MKTAIPALLASFDPKLRFEAERLVEDGAVVNLDEVEGQVDADVMMDEKPAHARWTLGADGWEGRTDVDDDLHDLALCATLVALHKNSSLRFPQPDLPVEPFLVTIEKSLGRQLSPEEHQYLTKLEKRFQRVQSTGQIFDHDMVRLNAKWSIESIEPLELWPEQPETIREFWDYVAFALDEKGLSIPLFLRRVTDLAQIRERLRAWRQASTVPQWKERIRRFAALAETAAGEQRMRCDFRLLITVNEARLQMKQGSADDADGGVFETVSAARLVSLRREHERGALLMDGSAELLLLACFCVVAEEAPDAFRLEVEKNAGWLGALFHQPGLHSRLLTLDETPFQFPPGPLHWSCADAADAPVFRLRLIAADGSTPEVPLRVLPGAETLYLGADCVYRGPRWFGDDTRVEAFVDIPAAALSSADGVAFLETLAVPLPDSIKKKIRRESLTVQIRAHCLARSPGAGSDCATLHVEALDAAGVCRESLRGRGWERRSESRPEDEGVILCHERSALAVAATALERLKAAFDPEQNAFRVRITKTFPDFFHDWAAGLPPEVTLTTDETLGTILADPLIARVRVEAAQTESIDWLDLRLVFDIEGSDLKPAEIRRLVAAKGGFVRLADGTWRRVQIELTDEQREMIEKLGIDLDELGDEAHRVHMRHLAGKKASEFINPKAWDHIAARLAEADVESKPPVPDALQATLRPYQVEGFHFLSYLTANHIGGILADDMGLGKTLQSIAWILWLRARAADDLASAAPPRPVLVVCPKSVLDVWATEFSKCAPLLRVLVLHEKDQLDVERVRSDLDVLVLNYAQLRGAIDQLHTVQWLAVILDEGQQIKNPDSKAAKAARQLRAENRLVLTGTPLENRLLDLWSLMTFAMPGALGDRAYFHRHFDRRRDESATERLSARLRPFMIRRTKGQVARELPARSEETMLCEMGSAQEQVYREELSRAQHMLLTSSGFDALGRQRFAILQALTRLRQICCHPCLVQHGGTDAESAKLTATLELIEELHAEGHKVLLFSQFVSMLKIIRARIEAMGLPFHWLTGASTNRAEIVRAFQEDERPSVFLLSLKAGGSGLNLTAASYVILYDPWWNPAVEAQAIDRAHRIGQTQPVMAYRMLTKGTIEEKIMLLQQKKNLMASTVLGGEEGFARTLEREDFDFLFDLHA
ncbi:MAG: DEAD/DEAH box helicase [Verrucomicrobiaceae bacterium]|nr:DEAD/DEAH box helicase [Verrucomicrobiaceae bacterium]